MFQWNIIEYLQRNCGDTSEYQEASQHFYGFYKGK